MSEQVSELEFLKEYQRKLVRRRTNSAGINNLLGERMSRRRCFACGKRFPPILNNHHIKPVSKNGESWVENIVRLCPNCHAIVHWANKRTYNTVAQRADAIQRFEIPRPQAFRIALLSTEEVYVNEHGAIQPRTKLIHQETLTHTELYQIFNCWPNSENVGEEAT